MPLKVWVFVSLNVWILLSDPTGCDPATGAAPWRAW